MTKFESSVKQISAPQETVYESLSDLSRLEKVKNRLPDDGKLKNFACDADSVSIEMPPVGQIVLKIVEKEPCKCVKYETVSSPLPFTLWIQLLPVADDQCKMKLTVGMELNPFMKAMVQKPLGDALEKLATALSMIDYRAVQDSSHPQA